MITYISAFLESIFSRKGEDLHNLIDQLFHDCQDYDLKTLQKNCSYILACVGYECFRMSSIDEREAAEALLGCNNLFTTASPCTLQQQFTEILIGVCQTVSGSSSASCMDYDILEMVNNLLYQDCASISLQEAASLFGVSTTSFSIRFKKKTGNYFKDYVRAHKMELAKRMLESTEDSVKTISETLGYFDYNYFTRIFKSTFGLTPTSYRRLVKY